MGYKFSPYLKTNDSYYGPKGNLGSYEHGSRLFVDNNMELAPKVAFLYHVNFVLNPAAKAFLPEFVSASGLGLNEIGLLAKTASLPKFSPQVETLNRYNQKKNIQTKIAYDPVMVSLHDDKKSLTAGLLQAYYKYYFVDGNYKTRPVGYNPNNTYRAGIARYGLDSRIQTKHFFKEIHISQLSRGLYTRYTLVNPLLTKFDHDDLDYADGNKALANNITIHYEAVFVETGEIDEDQGTPDGFAQVHYDHQPSSLSHTAIEKDFQNIESGNQFDLDDRLQEQRSFDNNFFSKQLQLQQRQQQSNVTFNALRRNGFNTKDFKNKQPSTVGGLDDLVFPKQDAQENETINLATRTKQIVSVSKNEIRQNPAALESARKTLHRQNYQAAGGTGGLAEADADFEAQKNNANFLNSLDTQLGL